MKKLQKDEVDLIGNWIEKNGSVVADKVCERIKWLVEEVLEKIAFSEKYGAWETLFRDPADGRLWERYYPHGEMHGGGPPALRCITKETARQKYKKID